MERDVYVFIEHIKIEIDKIVNSVVGKTKDDFELDENLKDATIRRIEVIGEAVKNIPEEFRIEYPEIEWQVIAGMRDKLIYNYFGRDLEKIWNVVEIEIPKLKKKIERIMIKK